MYEMDPKQREVFRDQVVVAMARRRWNSARTAKEAGLTENTMTRIMKAESVASGTILKLRKALEIPSDADAQADSGYSAEVEWARDVVGMWLRDMSEAERETKTLSLVEYIIKSGFKKGEEPPSITSHP
jgi:DNA-binding Xre family transcriptional regulator